MGRMLHRMRRNARLKLQRAVAEVVHESERHHRIKLENQHDQVLAELTATNGELSRVLGELAAVRDQVAAVRDQVAAVRDQLAGHERRARRDLGYAQDLRAAAESAAFVVEKMPQAPPFAAPHETLRFALSQVSGPGMALEFGVAGGTTLRIVVEELGARPGVTPVAGFDVFSGLPETWRTGFPAGEFAQESLPRVPGAQLVPGLFADTLPAFLDAHPGPVAFAHLDADLYSSTATVLELLGERFRDGTVLVFDEFFNYPGWRSHEYRAWTEFVARTGVGYEYLGYTAHDEQVAVRLTGR
ncbi:Macrocin-O-methyltransferase (TylF) [Rhodococcus tukisamuensis]|uniref:Macrocin-O-methyltransferase (TylF) n=2 Tax=Rhodococcus tukisamuensis TaxID=168276 RepID=A0A1G6MI11_9NOCA|nr:Macrocin-O-methyltransferase (TylF) [Rhodococcus tukisamuensis]